ARQARGARRSAHAGRARRVRPRRGAAQAQREREGDRALQAGDRSAAGGQREARRRAPVAGEAEAMTGTFSSRRAAIACATACAIVLGERAASAQKKFLIFGEGKVTYTTFRDMAGRFELEYPTKDWGSFPPGGSAIAILSRNDKTATLVID